MAELVRKQVGSEGGREGTLSAIGSVLVYLGFAGAIVLTFVGMVAKQNILGCLIGGIFLALNGVVANALLQSFAEVIRLLKKQNGMPYGGSIALVNPVYAYACSKCGKPQEHAVSRCWSCGESFGTSVPKSPAAKVAVAEGDVTLPQQKAASSEEQDRMAHKVILVFFALMALLVVVVLAIARL
jgi:hypothetical protein